VAPFWSARAQSKSPEGLFYDTFPLTNRTEMSPARRSGGGMKKRLRVAAAAIPIQEDFDDGHN